MQRLALHHEADADQKPAAPLCLEGLQLSALIFMVCEEERKEMRCPLGEPVMFALNKVS